MMKESANVSMRLLLVIPLVLLAALALYLVLCGDGLGSLTSGNAAPTGSIIVYVKEGQTDQPLEGATVVIPEINLAVKTDAEGKTAAIQVPIFEDASYRRILPKPWGEITLLVYQQGYIDCAIFHVNIWENQTRNGPTVLLFPKDSDDDQPFTLTEGPGRLWVNQLLNQFRPQGAQ